jgi:hypothetical protein
MASNDVSGKQWNERPDYAYMNLWEHVTWDETEVPARTRHSIAQWILADCTKLQYLAGMVDHVCYELESKLIVCCAWPMAQWLTEPFLSTLGIGYLSIKFSMSTDKRSDVLLRFNDASDETKILVTNLACSSSSANLQKCCHRLVIMELGNNVGDYLQAVGRAYRIGQLFRVRAYILVMNRSNDQYLQGKQTQNYPPQLAASSDIDVEAIRQLHDHIAGIPESSDGDGGIITRMGHSDGERLSANLEDLKIIYRALLGQRSFRGQVEWTDMENFDLKDSLP